MSNGETPSQADIDSARAMAEAALHTATLVHSRVIIGGKIPAAETTQLSLGDETVVLPQHDQPTEAYEPETAELAIDNEVPLGVKRVSSRSVPAADPETFQPEQMGFRSTLVRRAMGGGALTALFASIAFAVTHHSGYTSQRSDQPAAPLHAQGNNQAHGLNALRAVTGTGTTLTMRPKSTEAHQVARPAHHAAHAAAAEESTKPATHAEAVVPAAPVQATTPSRSSEAAVTEDSSDTSTAPHKSTTTKPSSAPKTAHRNSGGALYGSSSQVDAKNSSSATVGGTSYGSVPQTGGTTSGGALSGS